MNIYKSFALWVIFLLVTCSFVHAQNDNNLSSDDYYRLAKIEVNQKKNYAKGVYYCRKGIELSPGNYDLRLLLGKSYLELKNYDSARFELKKVNDKFYRNVDAKHYLINVEYSTGRYSSAICYVNELLEIKPYDKSLWLKKIAIYNDMGNRIEAKRAITRLYTIYPNDTMVIRAYQSYTSDEADQYYKKGNYGKSKELLQQTLEVNPRNLQAIQKLVNAHLNTGKKQEALATIEFGLANFPTDPILIEKKIGLLQEMGNYPDAISFCESILKKYPSAKLRGTLNELKIESARYYNNSDPYVLYQKVYNNNPGNEEAFNYLLNNALSKGYYTDAEELIGKKLKRNPNDKNTLLKQLSLLELENKKTQSDKLLEKLATKFPSDDEIQDKYVSLLLQNAKGYFQDQIFEQAKPLFEKLARYPDYRATANEYLYSIDVAQKNYPAALDKLNRLIANNPRNDDYLFKKASLYEEMGRFDEAIKITKNLSQKNPNDGRFKESYSNQSTPYIKQLIENEKYDSALNVIDLLLDNDPTNSLAYNYAIGVNDQMKNYDRAIDYCNKAMRYYPESKEFRLKKADLFHSKKDLDSSMAVLEDLKIRFPYNEKIKGSLGEAYFARAKKFENDFYIDSAVYYYKKTMSLNPKDTTSLFRITNLALDNQQYDSAKVYIESGLNLFPDNGQLLFKKGVLYDQTKTYDSAFYYVKQAENRMGGNCGTYQNYLNYLLSKTYKNQSGVFFTRIFFDSTQLKSAIASFEYTRFQPLNTYTYRLNYAARPLGTGIQQELEWFHKFEKKIYTQLNFAFSTQFMFPKIKFSLSGFKSMKYDWEAELGGRYILQRDNKSVVSAVAGIAKSWEEIWVNARGFVITDFNKVYQTLLVQTRYYFNMKNDYIMMVGSLGTPPEDRTLDFQLNSFLGYTTRMVGAGIQHQVKHRSTIGLQGSWYNYKIKSDYFYNQYNLFVTLLTKF